MADNYVPCPKCSGRADKLKFTWWGGILGPKLLTHVGCTSCGHKYNGRTGGDNTAGIIIYSVIAAVIAFGLLIVMFAAFGLLTMR